MNHVNKFDTRGGRDQILAFAANEMAFEECLNDACAA